MDSMNTRDRLIAWERLRVVYNAVMFLVGLPIAVSIYHAVQAVPADIRRRLAFTYSPISVFRLSFVFGLVANVMYMLGPMVEIYATTFGRFGFNRRVRLVVFSVGLLFSIAVQGVIWIVYQTLGFFVD